MMSITLKAIQLHLEDDIVASFFADGAMHIPLVQVKLIIQNQKEFKSNTVYVGTTSFVSHHKIDLSGANVILINDPESPLDISLAPPHGYIGLSHKCDLFEQFNLINNLFNNYIKLDAIRESDDLQQIATKGCELLENPIIFIDSGYRVLAHASHQPIKDIVWKENVERGYCSYEFIAYVRGMKDLKDSLNNSRPFLLTCYKSSIEKYASKLFVHGKLMGYMIVLIEDKAFNASEKELALEISKIGAACYKRNLSQRNLEHLGYENLLMDLLDNKITDLKTLDEKIKMYNESFYNQKVVLLLDISHFNSKNKPAGYLSTEIETILNKRHIYYDHKIVVLYDFKDITLTHMKQIKKLKAFATLNNIIIGVSNIFSDLILVRKHYLEAHKVIYLQERISFPDPLLQFKDVAFYVLLGEAETLGIGLDQYIHPSLEILEKYDYENQTDFYTTLATYLQNNQNAVSTSNLMFLHRNTIKYRIDKIIELTDLDLNNKDQVFNLLFSYKIKRYLYKQAKNPDLL